MKISVHGIKHWAWGFAIAGSSGFPLAARGMLNPALSVVLGNCMLMLGYSFIWTGMRQFVGAPVRKWWVLVAPLLALPVLSLFFLDDGNVPGRIAFLSTLIAGLSALPAWELLRRNDERRLGQRWVAWILLAHVGFNVCRAAYYGFSTSVPDAYALAAFPTATGVEAFLYMIFLVLGLIIMMSNTLQMELNRLASRDPLTDTYNRRAFHEMFERELSNAERTGRQPALLLIDIDNFKQLNDKHGHAVGDLALKHFVTHAGLCLRSQDVLARFGGEEFVVVLPECSLHAAHVVAERIRTRIATHPMSTANGDISFTVSTGATTAIAKAPDLKEVFDRADAALYQAKMSGRNCTVTA
ncbi:GGDEF domain-containing protein [Noviherbaspirillum galbum]|uniref:diguanylate cyclase n=1 Tax=Noviherbaspirillum galbum TaxID=2709383 RepID=A0A6B3SQA9_9BURK|nr:GGDEF domain-containing protein [Noviherbaspirillum galbum]NEX62954.1 GGDEF domain-containing protein [Noviherbaspirillum galbum]